MGLKINDFFQNAKPVSSLMIGIVFASFCLVLSGGALLHLDRLGGIGFPDLIQIIIMVFIAGTMFVGIRSHNHEKSYSQSAANLDSSISLINRAAEVLKDENGLLKNDRVSWVTCARLLIRAQALKSKINTDTHTLIYEAEHDFQRHLFRDLLMQNGKELGGAFFCGGELGMSIGEAVTKSSQSPDGSRWIPERILRVVYEFLIFPADYEDPLEQTEKFTSKERDRLMLLDHNGLRDYLIFRQNFYPLRNEIRRKNASVRSELSSQEIDDFINSERPFFEE